MSLSTKLMTSGKHLLAVSQWACHRFPTFSGYKRITSYSQEGTTTVSSTSVDQPDNHTINLALLEANDIDEDGPSISDLDTLPSDQSDFIKELAPYTPVSHNFAAYVNTSPTLQRLVELGVDLSSWEKNDEVREYALQLDFDRDVAPYVQFLHDNGIHSDLLGWYLTKNPKIIKEEMHNLQIRINYLKSKKFTESDIARIILNPKWLTFSANEVDKRLGYLQRLFKLRASEVRAVTVKSPKLPLQNKLQLEESTFTVREEMGFDKFETKKLLLTKPKIWLLNRYELVQRFDFVHNVMYISHAMLVDQPLVLFCRRFRLKQRHEYLVHLNKAQYDPKKPLYVPLNDLAIKSDADFSADIAKTSVQHFNDFIKTL